MKPACYNRPPFKDFREVQDGHHQPVPNMSAVVVPRTIIIDDPMSKDCKQWGELGAARLGNWDCDGCRWRP